MFKEPHPQPSPIFGFSMLGLDWPRDWTRLLLWIHPQIMQVKVHGSHQHTLKHHLLLKSPLPPHHHSAGRVLALSWQCPPSIYIRNNSMVSINSTLCVQVQYCWYESPVVCWHGHGVERQVKTLATAKTIFKTALAGEIRREGERERERERERVRESEWKIQIRSKI